MAAPPKFVRTYPAETVPSSLVVPSWLRPCTPTAKSTARQVRAGSLQELVYKQGQAGVTKATVSVTFNNSDRATSPPGYEHCAQLTVTRQVSDVSPFPPTP